MSALGTVRVEATVEGIPEIMAWLTGPFNKAAQQAADSSLDEELTTAKEDAWRNAPVGTPESTGIKGYIGGSHRRSIRKERLAKTKGVFTYQGLRAGGHETNPNTGKIVDYSAVLEYGGPYTLPRPHIRPAMRKLVRRWPARFYTHLGRRVKLE